MSSTSSKSKRTLSNEDSKRSSSKRKFRNENEKRRRDLFSQLIANLENILNIDHPSSSGEQTNKLDKASVLRETADYLKKHQDVDLTQPVNVSTATSRTTCEQTDELLDIPWRPPESLLTIDEWLQTSIEAMNCFFLVAKPDPHNGQIVHVSRNITSLLDYVPNELLNRSLFELILARDHDPLRDYLLKDHKVLEKCQVSWRRATADEYEECTIIGAFRQIRRKNDEAEEKYFLSIVQVNTLDRSLAIINENSTEEFTIRLNLQGRFIHVDLNTRHFLGYHSYELIGRTFFDFVHPDDLPIIVRAQKLWKEQGNGKSDPYRFLSKGQQWICVQTQCQVQMNSWTGKPESYLCTTNPLENSTDFLQKQSSSKSISSQMAIASVQSPLTTNPMVFPSSPGRTCAPDSQISSFISQLDNDTYRGNIREKLNERRFCKQAEIRVREEEINVIEDLVQYINEHELKRALKPSRRLLNPSLRRSSMHTTASSPYQLNTLIPEDRLTELVTSCDPLLIQLSLPPTVEDISPRLSTILTRDEFVTDPLPCPTLFSPQQGTFSIPSPTTPFSIPSRPSPMTPVPLSVSPIPSSPFPSSLSPLSNQSTAVEMTTLPPSSTSSPSSSSSTTTTTIANTSSPTTEQSKRKSSFNRSLPHSLVS